MKAPNGDDGRMFRITGEISKRPDGSEYYECNDGIQREVGPRNPPPSQDHLQELFQRCAQAIGIDDSPEYWRDRSRAVGTQGRTICTVCGADYTGQSIEMHEAAHFGRESAKCFRMGFRLLKISIQKILSRLQNQAIGVRRHIFGQFLLLLLLLL